MKHDKKAITAMVTGMAIGAALVSEAAAGIVAEPTWQKIYVDGQQVSMTAYTLDQSDEVGEDENTSWDFWTLRMDVQDEYSSLAERDDAVESMRELAESGDVHAQYFMGKLYRDGPLLPPDWVMARYWFDKAAKQGYTTAQYALGKLLLSDDVSVHDSEAGIQWLEHAAYNGNHYASYRLGKEYLKGESVRGDTRKAMDHIYTSAQAGNPHAQYLLGKLLLQGKVVERDKEEGIQWLTQAAEQGHSYAQCLLERQSASTAPEVFLAVTRLLHHIANIFQENSLPQSGTGLIHADRKLREQLREKRLAHGHKENDHEEQQYGGWNMTMK